jgi:hypothetical protein
VFQNNARLVHLELGIAATGFERHNRLESDTQDQLLGLLEGAPLVHQSEKHRCLHLGHFRVKNTSSLRTFLASGAPSKHTFFNNLLVLGDWTVAASRSMKYPALNNRIESVTFEDCTLPSDVWVNIIRHLPHLPNLKAFVMHGSGDGFNLCTC